VAVRAPAALAAVLALVAVATAAAGPPAVSGTRAKAFVTQLASAGPRVAGSANERRAARLVEARLRQLGYRISVQAFGLPDGGRSGNVVGRTSGPVRVAIVAHMDGVSDGPAANDNGSGVAAMLEVAAALRDAPGVLVAGTGAEERVETGSRIHLGAARLLRSLTRDSVRFVVSMDMVGFGTRLTVRGLEARPNASARLKLAAAHSVHVPVRYLRDERGVSDHAEIDRAAIPAVLLEWRDDPCWHSACDTADRVKPWKVGAAARLTSAAARAALGES
jgi:aminopeptidase S